MLNKEIRELLPERLRKLVERVVLKEEKMYIPGMQKGFGYEEYDRMKENIFEILSQRDPDKDRILLPCGWTHTYRK